MDGANGCAGLGLNQTLFGWVLGAGGEVGIGGGEAAEVVLTDEGSSGGIECGEIERPGIGEDVAREEGRANLKTGGLYGKNAVLVGFGDGGVASVEGVRDNSGIEDSDRSWKSAIEGAEEVCWRDTRLQRETGGLGERMHAGVGAAGALGQGRFADNATESGLQFTLDCEKAGLDLPAGEIGAVVGEGEFPRLCFSHRSLFQCGLDGVCHGNQCR